MFTWITGLGWMKKAIQCVLFWKGFYLGDYFLVDLQEALWSMELGISYAYLLSYKTNTLLF